MLKVYVKYKFIVLLTVLLSSESLLAQDSTLVPLIPPTITTTIAAPVAGSRLSRDQWVDSVMQTMSLEQRIGQLFMIAAYSNKDDKHIREIEKLIRENYLGGLIFFQGGPLRQAVLTNRYQAMSKVPLMIGMDAEWGLSMRLDSTVVYPKQMTLGAIQDNTVVYRMGTEIARQCKRLGVHINFAPVIDINSNPNNPVIGVRSFGEDKVNVALKGSAYMKGMQDHGVLASAKHFPGHGDTETDSHHSLPVVSHSMQRLQDIELYPFKQLIKDSIGSIMVGHIQVPAIDDQNNTASTLSSKAVNDLLKKELGYSGLVFTDALNMKGVSGFHKPGDVDVRALMAGNDVLLFAEDVPAAVEKIKKAIRKEDISESEINDRVRKILRAKFWLGLNDYKSIELNQLYQDLNSSRAKAVQRESYAAALTVVSNQQALVPQRMVDTTSYATVLIGADKANVFHKYLEHYASVKAYSAGKNADDAAFGKLLDSLKKFDVVVVGLHGMNPFSRTFGITEATKKFVASLQAQNKTILTVFGNPYSLKYFTEIEHVICAYEDNETTQQLCAQLIFGGVKATATLPVTAHPKFFAGKGITTDEKIKRLGYGLPENVGMDGRTLSYIDSICTKTVRDFAAPGCQVVVAKDGMIVYEKSFGTLGVDEKTPVTFSSLYDIASITKVAGTLQALMFLEERGLVDVSKKASHYLPDMVGTNKEDLILRDILIHQAGLQPFLAHWKKTMSNSNYDTLFYSRTRSDAFPNEVIPGLYSIASIEDSLWKWTLASSLNTERIDRDRRGRVRRVRHVKPEYVYSDLAFYITKRVVESVLNQPIEDFLEDNVYKPMGLRNLVYTPLDKGIPAERIAPTEYDKYFRKAIIRGNVHDPGAALLGGVGGHAGIFSNAHDLAVLFQMNLMNGTYGGQRYLMPGTVPHFSKRQTESNRRGLGWDKPEDAGYGPTTFLASSATYGHSGFTGTCVWIDPNYNLVYVFLSNRINTDVSNIKLIRMGVRTSIQEVIYKSIQNYKQ